MKLKKKTIWACTFSTVWLKWYQGYRVSCEVAVTLTCQVSELGEGEVGTDRVWLKCDWDTT
jgi:hypothetical protein